MPHVLAQYHSIYMLSFPSEDLVLRVSGPHLPKIKTENEAAIMAWVSKNTSIPVPRAVGYNSSTKNALGYEYILPSRAPGHALSDVYKSLNEARISAIIDELIDMLAQLHSHEWPQIGGLRFDKAGGFEVGPVLEETFWQVPDIVKYWPAGESVDTLNIAGPFPSYVEYITAHVRKYIYLIKVHESLAFMRDIIPRLEIFLNALTRDADELNQVKLRLAHKDLHFANVLYDVDARKITAILDWEFSGIVPFTRWNPTRTFLWNGHDSEDDLAEKQRLFQIFLDRCHVGNIKIPEDAAFSSPKQEDMQLAANFLRAITEVTPRSQKIDVVGGWKDAVLQRISSFGA
ncbi:MAG: hypothetical protein LQ340_000350 [Diploschistes diacapsis]|nr:MAG: hypothetical protein LQ340_000350 [Diploschistes diacapsis]